RTPQRFGYFERITLWKDKDASTQTNLFGLGGKEAEQSKNVRKRCTKRKPWRTILGPPVGVFDLFWDDNVVSDPRRMISEFFDFLYDTGIIVSSRIEPNSE